MLMLPKHLKIALGCGFGLVFWILFGWVGFPAILKSQLKKEMALSKKTDVRGMWEVIPFALDFKIYLFNYTNVDEIQNGAAPIVKEVGPYYFEEWKEKVDVEDHEDSDTITYKRKDTFYFRPDLSGPGLTGNEIITLPHPLIFVMVNKISRDKPAMLGMTGKALNGIFDTPANYFISAKALDIMFNGLLINCDRTEFAPKAACTALKKEAADSLRIEANNQIYFSIFGPRNATVDKRVITVLRGIRNVMDVGKVVAINGKDEQETWTGQCNKFEGTDATVFPPFLTKDDRLESFSIDLCRSFKPWYQKKTFYRGIATHRYIANIGDLSNDPELQCYCYPPGQCPPQGLIDVERCMVAPFYVSLPHFYDADPILIEKVKGLTPDANEHEIVIDFEPITGTPMVAKQRVQFNLQLLKTEKIEQCKNLPDAIAPIFWIEEGLALNKTFVNMLKYQLFIPKRVVGILKWLMLSGCSFGVLGGMIYHFKDKIMRFADAPGSASTTKVNPDMDSVDGNGPIKIET